MPKFVEEGRETDLVAIFYDEESTVKKLVEKC